MFICYMSNHEQTKFYRKLGAAIFEARIQADLGQGDLATKVNKTQSYISKIENGDIKVDLFTLTKLALALKIPVQSFISGK